MAATFGLDKEAQGEFADGSSLWRAARVLPAAARRSDRPAPAAADLDRGDVHRLARDRARAIAALSS